MKKVLFFIRENNNKITDFCKKLEIDNNIAVSVWNIEDVNIEIGQKNRIFNQFTKENLTDFDKIFTIATPEHERIHIFSTIGVYAQKNHIEMYDNTFTNTSGKLYEMGIFNANNLPIPETFFGTRDFIKNSLASISTGVLKTTHGAKGCDNYLVTAPEQIDKILNENTKKTFILQNFIKNIGDYRIIVIKNKAQMVIFRSSGGHDHRNNTSLGGEAKLIPLNETPVDLIKIAEEAARVTKIDFAGVDIVQDSETGKYYLLEINRTPQFTSGSFVEEKTKLMRDILLDED